MGDRRRIVLLDDDSEFVETLAALVGESHEVFTFDNPQDCIAFVLAEAEAIDLVCVDLFMPDATGVAWQLGGLDTIRKLRQARTGARPSVCALTGPDAVVHIYICLKNGADGYVEKSGNMQRVARAVIDQVGRVAA